jgi:hypothetical protein
MKFLKDFCLMLIVAFAACLINFVVLLVALDDFDFHTIAINSMVPMGFCLAIWGAAFLNNEEYDK